VSALRLRIAVVSDSVYPYHKGGKELRYHELLERLPDRGIDVDLYTMHWWDGASPAGAIRRIAIAPRIEMYANGRRTIGQALRFGLSCLRLLRIPRPAAIEADHMPYLQLFPLRLVAWWHRVPLIVTWHEVWGGRYWRSYMGPVGGTIAALIEKVAMHLPDHIIAVADGTAERLRVGGVDPERISIVHAGVRVAEVRSETPASDAPEILSLGRLIAHKRHDLVLTALLRVRAMGIPARLGVVGDGPERDALLRMTEELNLSEHVTFYGALPHDHEVWALLRGTRVLALPSEREGFGLAIAEGLAAGAAVITSRHLDNEARHLIDEGETGSLITPGDADELAEAIAGWLTDPGDRDARARSFERRHPHLSWDGAADTYAALVRRLVA
jgi:glycosyltransferase involved in cell wall biosynthesis